MPASAPPVRGRVRLIDDDPVLSRLVQAVLERRGYEVSCSADPREALERAQADPPDVILLDIGLPGFDGIKACRLLRARLPNVPIMFLTAGARERYIETALAAGAQDYIQKPFTEAELCARVASLVRLSRYEESLRGFAHELRDRNRFLSRELEGARRMHWTFLPASLAPHPSLRCAVLYEPMVEVGGDIYDLSLAPDGTVRFLVADVSGHGVVAALLAAFFKMGYQVYSDREPGPGRVLEAINRELCRSLDSGDFVTALAGWLQPETGTVRYASAGHATALLHHPRTGASDRLLPTGPVVGILEESRFEESLIQLSPGDALVLLTDGILEIPDQSGEIYGLNRVEAVAPRLAQAGPAQFLQELRIDLDAFAGATPPDDDLTALVLAWEPVPAAARS